MTAVDVRDLFRVHRTEEGDAAALQGLTLQVAAGEIVTVLGPSGSGKSTLLRSLAALEPPSAGVVLVFGRDVGRMAAQEASRYRAAEVGIVDQHYDRALSPDLSCEQIVALQPALLGIPERERHARAGELLARVGLAGAAGSRPDRLSGGERQRVAVCAALAHRPRLLLADEPSGELDAASAAGVYALIRELAHEAGTTVVLVSHDPGSVEIADRAVRIRDGRVAEEVRRDGREWAVIGHGGWVRIPPAMLVEGGFADHARIERDDGGLALRPEAGGAPAAPAQPATAGPAAADAGEAARLRGVSVSFGSRMVLDSLTAGFRSARLTVVSGRSGSGKSTLLAVLAGLQPPDSGTAEVIGQPLAGLDRSALAAFRAQSVAFAGQQPGLSGFLTATENIVVALAVRGIADGEAGRRAAIELRRLGLDHRAGQLVERLSAGERQRVAIARALAAGAPLVLVDEPTSRLDQASAELVAAALAGAAAETGAAIVCATHDPLLIGRAGEVLELGQLPD